MIVKKSVFIAVVVLILVLVTSCFLVNWYDNTDQVNAPIAKNSLSQAGLNNIQGTKEKINSGFDSTDELTSTKVDSSPQSFSTDEYSIRSIKLSQLPIEGQHIYKFIYKGGPFPFVKDGSVFGNYQKLLPKSTRGYYREYTVAAKSAKNRGAKRIICGGYQTRLPDICYYTEDHYVSFKKITP